MNFKERQELEGLPARIEKMENAVTEVHAAMADPAFYRKDREEIAQASTELENLERDLAAAYERWHVLEELAG